MTFYLHKHLKGSWMVNNFLSDLYLNFRYDFFLAVYTIIK